MYLDDLRAISRLSTSRFAELEALSRRVIRTTGKLFAEGVQMQQEWHKQFLLGWRSGDALEDDKEADNVCKTFAAASRQLSPEELLGWLNEQYLAVFDIRRQPQLMLLRMFRWDRIRHMGGAWIAQTALDGQQLAQGYTIHRIIGAAATRHIAMAGFEEGMAIHGLMWTLGRYNDVLTPAALWQLERTCQSLWEATPARSEGLTVVKMCFHGLGHAAVHASLRALPSELLGERQRLRVQDYGTCREPPRSRLTCHGES
jgi:hypothetical protein